MTLFALTDEAFQPLIDAGVIRSTTTLQGSEVDATYSKRSLFINQARVISPNGHAPNGVIHIIDAVLLPSEEPSNLLELLEADGRFTVLLSALEATGLDGAVEAGGVTALAPTDEAFAPLIEDGTIKASAPRKSSRASAGSRPCKGRASTFTRSSGGSS